MNIRAVKLELFYIRKAFFTYRRGFKYLINKYFLAPRILKVKKVLEKPINHQDLSIHILSSHRDLINLVWALASFYKNAGISGQLYIHSDGSLNNEDQKLLKIFFPSALVIRPDDFLKRHLADLESYPLIKKFRTEYQKLFLLKKLIDPYFVSSSKLHLIIDTDLLWFKS